MTFNSSFWELYRFVLKEFGLPVDFGHAAPDFVIGGNAPFWIEAVTANSAAGGVLESDADFAKLKSHDLETLLNNSTIRLANAVSSKFQKYQKRYGTLAHVSDRPFVLAVAPFEQPFFWFQNAQAITRVLYSYDTSRVEFVPRFGQEMVVDECLEYITKPNGSQVPLGYFAEPVMPEVSAVLYSNTATWGKVRALSADPDPHVWFETQRRNNRALNASHTVQRRAEYSESLLDGLYVFHNPHALRPLDFELFRRSGVTQYWLENVEMPVPSVDAADGALLQRHVWTTRGGPGEAFLEWWATELRES